MAELRDSVACATGAGVRVDRLMVDPGIGFAKRPAHSYGVLAGLAELAAALNRPDFDAIYVPHPIQDQTKQEIEARADAALLEIVARLTQF